MYRGFSGSETLGVFQKLQSISNYVVVVILFFHSYSDLHTQTRTKYNPYEGREIFNLGDVWELDVKKDGEFKILGYITDGIDCTFKKSDDEDGFNKACDELINYFKG